MVLEIEFIHCPIETTPEKRGVSEIVSLSLALPLSLFILQ